MCNVTRLRHALLLGPDINASVSAIAKAIDAAKVAGLPQGLIVSLLHGRAHNETANMTGITF